MFSFLAGTQPTRQSVPYVPTGVHDIGSIRPIVPPLHIGCQAPSLRVGGEVVSAPPGLVGATASPPTPTQAELGMILKAIQTFLNEMPKIQLGDVATRATRLLGWKSAVELALIPVGYHFPAGGAGVCRKQEWHISYSCQPVSMSESRSCL